VAAVKAASSCYEDLLHVALGVLAQVLAGFVVRIYGNLFLSFLLHLSQFEFMVALSTCCQPPAARQDT
jgi:hypothetical protein